MRFVNPLLFAPVVALILGAQAFAHQNALGAPGKPAAPMAAEQKAFGIAGDPRRVTRTIPIRMTDRMRFEPSTIRVSAGETVRFVHRNAGKVLHEMVIGTPAELEAHAEQMRKHPGMEHDEPYMAHVAAGSRGEIVWHFNRTGEFAFACLVPGHYEAGMRGTISVAARP